MAANVRRVDENGRDCGEMRAGEEVVGRVNGRYDLKTEERRDQARMWWDEYGMRQRMGVERKEKGRKQCEQEQEARSRQF